MELSLSQVLLRPLPSGKGDILKEQGKYVFEVHPQANRLQVKEAVSKAFNVKVKSVNIIKVKGERRRSRAGWYTTRSYKKAIVTLKEGFSISLVEGV